MRQGFDQFSVSVNVSAYQLQNCSFLDHVKDALTSTGLEAKYLHLELTESVMIHESLKITEMMKKLMRLGVNISIDDFGTGYSSLSYLKNSPIDRLKIDRSFIQNLDKNSPDYLAVCSCNYNDGQWTRTTSPSRRN